ncbi:nucleotidyltransferase domain-containing protein [Thermoflexus hugenholtzii]|uniref:Nucleotidyltransferase domain-containing protein n=1 Tax=Thermoflexus hugenholtzii JAD2 TaxID=877466 RepID=A0A212QSS0_9CHLR|nr:nucleotidyltransferase domain-containing protein [Thermoflexus hugenholtzii]SNB62639.1 Nucleotidyltransferase domain-containing protein [Thermoflexus hugenholtzii JAD2]
MVRDAPLPEKLPQRRAALEAERAHFLEFLRTHYAPQQVILFGSLTEGRLYPDSDLDLVVVMPSSRPFLERIGEMLERFRPRVGMDLLVYTPEEFEEIQNRPFFREEVLAKGVVLYESPSGTLASLGS